MLDYIEGIKDTSNQINSHTKYIYYTVNYKSGFNIKKTYGYNDGMYTGRLELYEVWGKRDGTWDAIYAGYVTSNQHINSRVKH